MHNVVEDNRCPYTHDKVLVEMVRDHSFQMFHAAYCNVNRHIEMAGNQEDTSYLRNVSGLG